MAFEALRGWTAQQKHAVTATFFAWATDVFDYFVLVFVLKDVAAEFGAKSWAQFFLKYIVAHPAVTCVIPGTGKVRHMQDNLNAGRGRLPDARMRKRMVELIESF